MTGNCSSNKFSTVGRVSTGIEEWPQGKHVSVKTCWIKMSLGFMQSFMFHLQCTRTAEQSVCTQLLKQDPPITYQQSTTLDLFSKLNSFSFIKERCLVISSSFPLASKMCSQAAEITQEFKPATLKKATSNENFLQAECN